MTRSSQNRMLLGEESVMNLWLDLFAGWKLDEESDGSGAVTRVDVLGNYNLTDNNTVASVTDATFGEVADFVKANNESLSYANFPSIGATFTTSLWYKLDPPSVNLACLISNFTTWNAHEISYAIDYSGGGFRATIGDGSESKLRVAVTDDTASWHHLVLRMKSDRKLYLSFDASHYDGTVALSGTPWVDETETLYLGDAKNTLTNFDGRMRAVYLFNAAKSDAWISNMYNGGAGRDYPG